MSNIKKLVSNYEKENHPPFSEDELAKFLWEVREQRAAFIVRKETMLRLFVTLAEEQE